MRSDSHRRGPRKRRPFLYLAAAALVMLAGVVTLGSVADDERIFVIGVAFLLVYVLPLACRAAYRAVDPFECVYLISAGYFLAFMFPVIVLPTLTQDDYIHMALVIATSGLAFFLLGYFSPLSMSLRVHLPRLTPYWEESKVTLVVICSYALSWITRFYLVSRYGLFFNDIVGYYAELSPFIGVFTTVEGFYLVSFVLLSIFVFTPDSQSNSQKGLWRIFWFLMFLIEIGYSVLRGVKGGVTLMILMALIPFHYLRGIKFRGEWRWILVSGAFLIFLFPVMSTYRNLTGILGSPQLVSLNVDESFAVLMDISGDAIRQHSWESIYSGFKQIISRLSHIEVLSSVVAHMGGAVRYEYGKSYLFIISAFIPRFIWPGKFRPLLDAEYAVNLGLQSPEHLTVTDFGTIEELYINFSFLGVALGMMVFGVISRVAYDYLIRDNRSSCSGVFLYTFVVMSFLDSLEHPGSQVIFGLIRTLPILLVTIYLVRKKAPRPLIGS